MLLVMQRRILFPRHFARPDHNAGQGIAGLEKIWIDSDQGKVESWFIAGDRVSSDSPGPAVIFAHGNAELIEYWPEYLSQYLRMGVSLFLPEYRGYGRSAGSPSQKAIEADFEEFYKILIARKDVDPKRLIYHGRSLGGGAMCALAAKHPPKVMILQSTFTSVVEMAKKFFFPAFLVKDPFDNESILSTLDIPVLIFHGKYDDLIPYPHAIRLQKAAKNAKLITLECSHNDCPPSWAAFWINIKSFLKQHNVL
jgi:fermentation-respiration switch protein FrsA (DUF1100 family)